MADHSQDDGRVALIKSLTTGNRFYALVPRSSGISNADTVDEIPHDLLLGIAYPCLEDALNDFAVIRTAYETLELFPDDAPLQRELHEIISDARRTLVHRLMELLERIIARRAYFLGTDLEEFKTSALDIMQRGFPRHSLDGMMKVNVFSSVARAEADKRKTALDEPDENLDATSIYRYEFHNSDDLGRLSRLPGREFLLSLLADVLDSVLEDDNYPDKNAFDQNVFQSFIALIFITYAATDSAFYGTHKDDYGVSRDKDMDDTPLYIAIGRELRRIAGMEKTDSNQQSGDSNEPQTSLDANSTPLARTDSDASSARISDEEAAFFQAIGAATEALSGTAPNAASKPNQATSEAASHFGDLDTKDDEEQREAKQSEPAFGECVPAFPALRAREELLLGPIASICATANQMGKRAPDDSAELTQLILQDAARLVRALKSLRLISPLASNPGEDDS